MKKLLLGTALLALATPVQAQTLEEYVDKALLELTATKNAAARAEYAMKRVKTKVQEQVPAPAPTPTPVPTPTPEPAPTGWVPSPSLEGKPPIASNFDPKLGMDTRAPLTRLYNQGAPFAGEDGAFRFTAGGDGPLGYIDPVAFHGLTDPTHLHLFFCGINLTKDSTYESIRANPSSNCSDPQYPLNPSGYWVPIFTMGNEAIRPEYITVYYKRCSLLPNSKCLKTNAQYMGIPTGLPNGIVLITGWDPQKPNGADGIANNADDSPGATFYCTGGTGQHYYNLNDVFRSGCKAGDLLVNDIIFPDCWDGKNLDSPNHRDHVVRASYGSWGYPKCPADHPYVIPTVQFKPSWIVTADMYATENGVIVSKMDLSCAGMKPGGLPGSCTHADWQPAWDPVAQAMWLNCLDKGLDGIAGDLCTGFGIKGNWSPSYGWSLPVKRSPIPPRQQ